MSYAGTKCRCGARKEPDTLVCATCMESADPYDRKTFLEGGGSIRELEDRRWCAFRILSHAHRRTRGRQRELAMEYRID